MMMGPYETVSQRVPFALLEGNGTLIQSGSRDRVSPARRRSMPPSPKTIKSPRDPNTHIMLGSLGAEVRDWLSQNQLQRQRWSLWAPARLLQPHGRCLHPPPQSQARSEYHCRWLHQAALRHSRLHIQVCLHICWHRATYFRYFHLLQHCIYGKYIRPAAVNHHFTMNIYLDYYCNADVLNH